MSQKEQCFMWIFPLYGESDFHIYLRLLEIPIVGVGNWQKADGVIRQDYPNRIVYVMSGVDGYYEKLGYRESVLF